MKSEAMWRIYLDDLCRRMKADQKKAFTDELEVTQATINRWRRGEDWPNSSNLERLLAILSEGEREHMLLLMRQDSKVWSLLPLQVRETELAEDYGNDQSSTLRHGELDNFFLKLLRLQRDTPDRFWQLCSAILRECITRMETHPLQVGIEVSVVTCMPPRDGKVRSLRSIVAMGTSPWRGDLHMNEVFLGLESLPGYVVTTRRGHMIPDLAQDSSLLPAPCREHERSTAAFPIMVSSGTTPEMTLAGSLVVSCVQPNYFTVQRMDILEDFADIIRLALSDDLYKFYPASLIELAPLPPWDIQRDYLETFRERVTAESRRLKAEGHEFTFDEVKNRVWEYIESELLQRTAFPSLEKEKVNTEG